MNSKGNFTLLLPKVYKWAFSHLQVCDIHTLAFPVDRGVLQSGTTPQLLTARVDEEPEIFRKISSSLAEIYLFNPLIVDCTTLYNLFGYLFFSFPLYC